MPPVLQRSLVAFICLIILSRLVEDIGDLQNTESEQTDKGGLCVLALLWGQTGAIYQTIAVF